MPLHLPRWIDPRSSFRTRLLMAVGAITVVTTLGVSGLVARIASDQVKADKGTLLAEVAHNMTETLDRGIAERLREVQVIAALDAIRDPKAPLAQKQALLDTLKASYDYYAWIGIADTEGNIIAGSEGLLVGKNVAQRAWFTHGGKGPSVGDVHDAFLLAKLLPRPQHDYLPLRLLDVSTPIHDADGKLVGVLCGHLSWDWSFQVRNEILEPLRSQFEADVVVLGKDDNILLGTPALQELSPTLSLPSGQAARAQHQGYLVEPWPDGGEYLTGYAASIGFGDYPGLGWKVLVRQQADAAFAPADRLAHLTFAIITAAGLAFMVVLALVAGRLTRPMRAIADAADRIHSGQQDTNIPVYAGRDEIASLSASLADLVHTLRDQNRDLRLAAQVFGSSTEGILIADAELKILSVNQAFSHITGYTPEEVVGRSTNVLASGRHDKAFYQAMWESILKTGRWQGEIYNRRKDGTVYPEWLIITSVKDAQGRVTNYIGIFTDISERKQTEERILYLAKHDVLTDLPNRIFFLEAVEQAIAVAAQHAGRMAVLFVDLDRFKNINDSLGHHLGDLLLKEVARRFNAVVGAEGFVARWGGDEFVVLIRELADREQALRLGERIGHTLSAPFEIAGHQLNITSSIGVSIYPDDDTDLILLIRNADTAMFQAKARGRDNLVFFTQDMSTQADERLRLENDLRRAIPLGQLSLAYQPQVDLISGRIVGVEALLRWNHPELGPISPAKFIPVAEDTGLIAPLGEWVLRKACEQQMAWEAAFGIPLRMAVNLSPVQFQQGDLAQIVIGIVRGLGMNPSRLELEITENVLVASDRQVMDDLRILKQEGLQVALDDFGTGYSSLRYISQLDIHKIKIDQSFVRNLSDDPQNISIVAAIVAMAINLDITVLAEGIETPEAASILAQMGCNEGQGYLYSRPLAPVAIEQLLRDQTVYAVPGRVR